MGGAINWRLFTPLRYCIAVNYTTSFMYFCPYSRTLFSIVQRVIDYQETQNNIMRNPLFVLVSFVILSCLPELVLSQTRSPVNLPFGKEILFFNNRLSVAILSNDENSSIHTPPSLLFCVRNKTNVSLPMDDIRIIFDSLVSERSKSTEARYFEPPAFETHMHMGYGPLKYNGGYFSPENLILLSGYFSAMRYYSWKVENGNPVYEPLKIGSYIYHFHVKFLYPDNKEYSFPFKCKFEISGSAEDQSIILRNLAPSLLQFKAQRQVGTRYNQRLNSFSDAKSQIDTVSIMAVFRGNRRWEKHIAMAMALQIDRSTMPKTLQLYKTAFKAYANNCRKSGLLTLLDASLWLPDGGNQNDNELSDYLESVYKSHNIPDDFNAKMGVIPASVLTK